MESLAYVSLNGDFLIHNILQFRGLLSSDVKIALTVKGNAYGHGLKEIVGIADNSVDYFQVNDVRELIEVRGSSTKKVLVLGYVRPQKLKELNGLNAEFAIYSLEQLKAIEKEGLKNVSVHLKLDSLLGREGILLKELPFMIQKIKSSPSVKLVGVYSHFSNIEDTSDFTQAEQQINIHEKALSLIKEASFTTILEHISASSGILAYESIRRCSNLVRLGIGAYGLWPSYDLKTRFAQTLRLEPVLKWATQVAEMKTLPAQHPIGYGLTYITAKPTRIALVPQGYADGYDRGLSNSGEVLIQGSRCPVLGRVSMNMFVVDVSHLKKVVLGEEIVLLGRQGDQEITAEEIAAKISSINYEVVTRISPLIPRVLKNK